MVPDRAGQGRLRGDDSRMDLGPERTASVTTAAELGQVLRQLRRRYARARGIREPSYRAIAGRTGWSLATVGEYFSGKTLPPTDRFDVLVGLLGATGAERGALATARDRVAELSRGDRREVPPERRDRGACDGPDDTDAAAGPGRLIVPRQLPADIPAFTGRRAELLALDRSAATGNSEAGPRPTVVTGAAGVGKTALVVHWAHRVAAAFPDGQLYLDLRGHDAGPQVSADEALRTLLAAVGVPEDAIPAGADARAALYRSSLAGRRLLVVLDNAATVTQVRPLLPGSAGSVVVVTSRDTLAGLVARDGAIRLELDLLPAEDARRLLRRLVGGRGYAEPAATDELAALCARLPLALRNAAELAGRRPSAALSDLVGELRDQRRRLDLLAVEGDPRTDVREVFSWSYRDLPASARRAFRLLGLHPGRDFDTHAVAALLAADPTSTAKLLDALARLHLLDDAGPGRYGMHDLIRAYAVDLCISTDSAAETDAALKRLLDHYLATAAAAMDVVHPGDRRRPRTTAMTTTPLPPDDRDAAAAWLDAERSNLLAVARHAYADEHPRYAIDMARMVSRYLGPRGHHAEAIALLNLALDAARLVGDEVTEARAAVHLGVIHERQGEDERAAPLYRQALEYYRMLGGRAGEAVVLGRLASVAASERRYRAARAHQRRVLALHRQLGDRVAEGRCLNDLGTLHLALDEPAEARPLFADALELAVAVGNRYEQGRAHAGLGDVHRAAGDVTRARRDLQRALALFTALGVPDAGEAAARLASLTPERPQVRTS